MRLAKVNMADMLAGVQRLFIIPVLLLLGLLATLNVFAQNFPPQPNPPRLVNDFAHLMSDAEVNALEIKLDAYNDSTSTQIAIVTIESLEGAEVGSYAAELGKKWGVGTKQNHNGVIILVSKAEHKVTIRTGYGVEEKLGAIICNRIIENQLTPNFKAGNYYAGFDAATTEIIQRLSGTFKGTGRAPHSTGIPVWMIIAFIVFILIILPAIFGGGGGGGTFGGGGFIGGFLGGFGAGGGFGGGGGGGDGGGGFGGFGGGDFSGGGSSGSW